ncbi:MAG: serine/threonine-protein kinase [Pirellulales bacterium]
MAEVTTHKLVDLIKRSGLVETDRLDAFLDSVASSTGGELPEDPSQIAKRIVDAGLITRWQADKLLAGKHKGFTLGKYKLLSQIGKGGMSSVYLAEHVLMRRRVAIKVLPRERVKDASYLDRFRLEARAVARLDDPNIVRAYDIDNEGETHYIVMEYVDGKDLHQLVSEHGAMDYETAADYVAQVAKGLDHAHSMGLVHRDIKPANCLVDRHRIVKLLDLGLAKLAEDDQASLTLANEENVLGTADYLAPEQALNSHLADARADIYSLGCTLYFLLAARPPFPEGSISERLLKHQVETPDSLLKFRPDAPLSLVEICNRMMCKRPEDRYQTAGDVAQRLAEWLAQRGKKVSGGPVETLRPDSGIGSGILSRFPIAPPTPLPGATPASSETLAVSQADRDTAKLYEAESGMDDDIGLAPLDDEDRPATATKKKPSPKSSGVLSDELGDTFKKATAPTPAPSGPKRSLLEEEFHKEDVPVIRPTRGAENNPLHPPNYVSPYKNTPWGLWLLLGVGALIILFVLYQVL